MKIFFETHFQSFQSDLANLEEVFLLEDNEQKFLGLPFISYIS